ncbi:MAG TPA: hypothetical protein VF601_02740 [Beijerinckiaceae bacterium]
MVLVGLGLGVAPLPERALAQAQPQARRQPYEGVWGGDGIAACRDQDGVNRMEITGNRFFWYETRCRAQGVKAEGRRSWTMNVSCEGEGQRFRARPRLSLPAPNRLVMENAPVGPTKRQVYVRCAGAPAPARGKREHSSVYDVRGLLAGLTAPALQAKVDIA